MQMVWDKNSRLCAKFSMLEPLKVLLLFVNVKSWVHLCFERQYLLQFTQDKYFLRIGSVSVCSNCDGCLGGVTWCHHVKCLMSLSVCRCQNRVNSTVLNIRNYVSYKILSIISENSEWLISISHVFIFLTLIKLLNYCHTQ